MKTRKGQNAVL